MVKIGINCDIIGINSTGNNMISWIRNKLFNEKRNHDIIRETILVGDQLQLKDNMEIITVTTINDSTVESLQKYQLLGPYGSKIATRQVNTLRCTPFAKINRNLSYDGRKTDILRHIEVMKNI